MKPSDQNPAHQIGPWVASDARTGEDLAAHYASGDLFATERAIHYVDFLSLKLLSKKDAERLAGIFGHVPDEITLVGSRCGPLPKALHLLAAGAVDPLPLIEGRHPLPQALRAFEHAAKPGSLKILLEMEGV